MTRYEVKVGRRKRPLPRKVYVSLLIEADDQFTLIQKAKAEVKVLIKEGTLKQQTYTFWIREWQESV